MTTQIRVTKISTGYRIDLMRGSRASKLATVVGQSAAKEAMRRATGFQREIGGGVPIVWDSSRGRRY